MATFTPCIRSIRKDGFAQAYIRISHRSASAYIKTDYWVEADRGIKDGNITDRYVLTECLILIKDFMNKLNGINIKNWTVQQVRDHILLDSENISFTDFAEDYITKNMTRKGRTGAAANYRSSLNSLKAFLRKDDITFQDLSTRSIRLWIHSLAHTKRAKSMYPQSIKTIFEAGLVEYNDYDNEVMLIKNNPFKANKIPMQSKHAVDRMIEVDMLKKILLSEVTGDRATLAKDVAFIIFGLAGINTADLYLLEKSQFKKGKLSYNRKKTMAERSDDAYFEITVPDMILPLFKKHKGKHKLFNFSELYHSTKEFNKAVNEGLRQVSAQLGVKTTTSYTYRKTWSTIAQNDCGVSTELVAFCLNHASAHRVTEGYIKKDFTPVDRTNAKVLDFVFKDTGGSVRK